MTTAHLEIFIHDSLLSILPISPVIYTPVAFTQLFQCQWSHLEEYGHIRHDNPPDKSKQTKDNKTMCIFCGLCCITCRGIIPTAQIIAAYEFNAGNWQILSIGTKLAERILAARCSLRSYTVAIRIKPCSAGPEITVPRYMANHDAVIKWKHFPRYWPFVQTKME